MSTDLVTALIVGQAILTLALFWLRDWALARQERQAARESACSHARGRIISFDGHLTWRCSDCRLQVPLTGLKYIVGQGCWFLRSGSDPIKRAVALRARQEEPE